MKWIESVDNGATTLCDLFDDKGNKIAEVRCLQGHRGEILEAWDMRLPENHQKALALAGYISRMPSGIVGGKEWFKIHKRATQISTLVRRGKGKP